jgi:iron(III) transport system permease protein
VNAVLFRWIVAVLTALAVLAPIGLVVYQAFLSGPFFQPSTRFSLAAFSFVFSDPDFWDAFWNSLILAVGMALIAAPIGSLLAFLVTRTDLPGRGWLEPIVLIPIFLSPLVLAFGYVVALGPVGFLSTLAIDLFDDVPWNLYSMTALVLIAGLTHVPHVYLYAAAALRSLGADLEEAARTTGAGPWRVALDVSLPMVSPAILYGAVLVFFLGFEVFGLPLILGDPQGLLVLSTYLFKLTNKLGVPSYQLMAVVVMVIIAVALPLVALQRYLLRASQRYVAVRGKAAQARLLPLGRWRWPAAALILAWFGFTVAIPLAGLVLRSFVTSWGVGVRLSEVLTLSNYTGLLDHPTDPIRAIVNTLLIGTLGGALAVAAYAAIALAQHRWNSGWARLLDSLVMLPRAMPGLVAGLAMLWLFLFVKPLSPLRQTLFSIWLAYTLVWLAYGLRLIQASLVQVGGELEEAARTTGASEGRAMRDVTLPLIRYGLLASWLLIFLIFVREYSTGVYLLAPGTEVIGSLLVSLWGTGAVELVTALAVANVAILVVGLAVAVRLGVRLHG